MGGWSFKIALQAEVAQILLEAQLYKVELSIAHNYNTRAVNTIISGKFLLALLTVSAHAYCTCQNQARS